MIMSKIQPASAEDKSTYQSPPAPSASTSSTPMIEDQSNVVELSQSDMDVAKASLPVKKNRSKSIGNKFENRIARELGEWIFGDKNVFCRSITSGANRAVYYGDVIPLKQLGWTQFPFLIEAKNGYKQHLPTMMNWTKLKEWLNKYLKECDQAKSETGQYVLLLICGFHNYTPLLFTNYKLAGIPSDLMLSPLPDHSTMIYAYSFTKIKEYQFYDLFSDLNLIPSPTAIDPVSTDTDTDAD